MTEDHLLTELPFGLPGRIFRSPMPFSSLYDPHGNLLEAYENASVKLVLVLVESEEIRHCARRDLLESYRQQGIGVFHAPITDLMAPEAQVMEAALEEILRQSQVGMNVAVHCHAGIGRTGMVMACLAKRVKGMDADEAIDWVKRFIPGAIETSAQKEFVKKF